MRRIVIFVFTAYTLFHASGLASVPALSFNDPSSPGSFADSLVQAKRIDLGFAWQLGHCHATAKARDLLLRSLQRHHPELAVRVKNEPPFDLPIAVVSEKEMMIYGTSTDPLLTVTEQRDSVNVHLVLNAALLPQMSEAALGLWVYQFGVGRAFTEHRFYSNYGEDVLLALPFNDDGLTALIPNNDLRWKPAFLPSSLVAGPAALNRLFDLPEAVAYLKKKHAEVIVYRDFSLPLLGLPAKGGEEPDWDRAFARYAALGEDPVILGFLAKIPAVNGRTLRDEFLDSFTIFRSMLNWQGARREDLRRALRMTFLRYS